MRMRTIEEGFSEIKQRDPKSAITKTMLRRLVVSGALASTKRVGAKYIFDLCELESYMEGKTQAVFPTDAAKNSIIRRLPDRM